MQAFSLLFSLLFLINLLESVCYTPRVRKEIRELSDDEYNRYVKAALILKKRSSSTSLTTDEKFTKLHNDGAEVDHRIHSAPAFLPWHRKFIKDYELQLQKIDPSINLPYWDWSQDGDYPHLSPVLTPLYFGGNGNRAQDKILDNGPFNFTQLIYTDPHPLRRDYDQGDTISPFASTTDINSILANSKFSKMANDLEGVHGPPHTFIGNWEDFAMNTSPNDPIFYLHHAFIDLVWAKWQEQYPKQNQYEGDDFRMNVTLSDKLYGYNLTVNSTLNFKSDFYCYTYPTFPRKIYPKRSNNLMAKSSNRNNLIDDQQLNLLIKGLTLDQAITKLQKVHLSVQPLLHNLTNTTYAINSLKPTFPKRTPLPDHYIDRMKLDKVNIRRFEKQQLQLRQLFQILKPVKDFIKG